MDPVGPTEFDHLNAPECRVKDSFGSEFLRFARLQPYNVTSLMLDWSHFCFFVLIMPPSILIKMIVAKLEFCLPHILQEELMYF